MPRTRWTAYLSLALLTVTSACASYRVPGRGADFALLRPSASSPPAAHFPATLAIVRVQAAGYESYSIHRRAGDGKFSVVTVRDIEIPPDFERFAALPQVRTVVSFTRQSIPGELRGADDLRRVGAELHADVVLAYTLDTRLRESVQGPPLERVSLGASPTGPTCIDSTASALLLDTRTGYVYGAAEATESAIGQSSPWWTAAALDDFRRRTERAAFAALLGQLELVWGRVIAEHASAPSEVEAANSGPPF